MHGIFIRMDRLPATMHPTLQAILEKHPSETSITDNPEAVRILHDEILPFVNRFQKEAFLYCEQRDLVSKQLAEIKGLAEDELYMMFADAPNIRQIIFMSSVGSRTHVLDTSDLDFGVIFNDLDENTILLCADVLDQHGYQFNGICHGYPVYGKEINGVDVEVKIRKFKDCEKIIRLHQVLECLPENTKQLLTYAKVMTQQNSELYARLKNIIYSAYFTTLKKRI